MAQENNNEKEVVYLNIPFTVNKYKDLGDGRRSKKVFMRISDGIATLSYDDGSKVTLGGGFGGSYPITCDLKGYELEINAKPADVWNAYCDAMGLPADKKIKQDG